MDLVAEASFYVGFQVFHCGASFNIQGLQESLNIYRDSERNYEVVVLNNENITWLLIQEF